MDPDLDYWRMLAGLGLFLFGMMQLEAALKRLAGRPFKQLLGTYTQSPLRAVFAGALATAALQSSSVVSLIVQAFVAVGVISLVSGIGVVVGSNLGTTATGWLVASLGFKLSIDTFAFPLLALGGFVVLWSAQGSRSFAAGRLFIGLGLMLLGLHFMKEGAVQAAQLFDPAALRAYPLIVFLAAGLVLTALIQSSSASITITLSALYAGVIPLNAAAAVVIGANLGTTITAVLGALDGSSDKRRVAAAHVIFNVVNDVIAFALLVPLLFIITDILGLQDPLYSLVAFHSLFNLLGILIFLPVIPLLTRFLQSRFSARATPLLRYLQGSESALTELSLENLSRETCRLIDQAAALNQQSFGLKPQPSFYPSADDRQGVQVFEPSPSLDHCYAELKEIEGAILSRALEVQSEKLEAEEAERLSRLFPALRGAVHSAKCLRSTLHDLAAFRDSANDRYHAYFGRFREAAQAFYQRLADLGEAEAAAMRFELLVELKTLNAQSHAELHSQIYQEVRAAVLEKQEVSTLLNVNRQLYLSNESLLSALADSLLDKAGADAYAALPAPKL